MADPVVQLSNAISTTLNDLLSNNFISSSVLLGLSFYAYKAAPALPSFVEELFENVFFQIFVGFMVLYMNTQNFMLSLVVSVVFVYGMKMFSGLKEGMFGGDKEYLNAVSQLNICASIGGEKEIETEMNRIFRKFHGAEKKEEIKKLYNDNISKCNQSLSEARNRARNRQSDQQKPTNGKECDKQMDALREEQRKQMDALSQEQRKQMDALSQEQNKQRHDLYHKCKNLPR